MSLYRWATIPPGFGPSAPRRSEAGAAPELVCVGTDSATGAPVCFKTGGGPPPPGAMSQIKIGDVYCPPGASYAECEAAIEAMGHEVDPAAKPGPASVQKSKDVAGEVERQRWLAKFLADPGGSASSITPLLAVGGVAALAWYLARRRTR